jgi:hypothetical protein
MKGKKMKKIKRRNTLLLSLIASLFKKKTEKFSVSCATAKVHVNNCVEILLEAEDGKYLYIY